MSEGSGDDAVDVLEHVPTAQHDAILREMGADEAQEVRDLEQYPPDTAGGNECHFYFLVKDDQGGERKSDTLFVDRAPFKFSV